MGKYWDRFMDSTAGKVIASQLPGAAPVAAIGYVGKKVKDQNDAEKERANSGGIATPDAAPANPYQTAPGLQADAADQWAPSRFGNAAPGSGGQTQTPQGWDFSSPGVAEQYWNQQQGQVSGPAYAAPGAGEQYWNQVAGKFNAPTRSGQQADAGVSAYFDRATTKAQEQMQRAQAASGTLGSSVGNESIQDAIMGLRAQEAMQGANYDLQAAGQADQALMQQLGLGGDMASTAQQLGLARGQADLSRFNAGMNASLSAQDARRTRGQDMYGNVYAPANAMAGAVGDTMNDMIMNDQEMMDAALAAELGLSQEMLNQSYAKADRQKDDEKHGMSMTKDFMSLFGGGGMGG